ncbi:MAG TPA: S8 family peptidase [Flavobacterium sp.]|jgi:subtilisin family serine protease
MKLMRSACLTALALLAFTTGVAQTKATTAATSAKITPKVSPVKDNDLKRWSHLDPAKDTLPGMSVDRAYSELLKSKKGSKIIVGVIDSGIDIEHEDLKSAIWTNTKEIAGNNIDDDKNGYVDDIHGWNFLGNASNENLEMVRILKKGNESDPDFKAAKAAYEEQHAKAMQGKQQVDFIFNAHNQVSEYLKKDKYTLEEVNSIEAKEQSLGQAKMIMMSVIGQIGPDFLSEINEFKDQVSEMLEYNLNMDFDGRKIVGDNPEDINNRNYGNNNVIGPDKKDALHGTHVAGIIAQSRNNGIGGDGVANLAEIMAIRAVPNGDEYDKDIALAIRYAVDNGAKVINGSFGKSFSPHKDWVFDAIKYAASKDVLIVHAAGNDGHDIDLSQYTNFPNDSKDGITEISDNMLTVGALSPQYGPAVVAEFSNYGKRNVDVYAPGAKIYATVPGNKYKYLEGTSMASPNAAGVAALVRSYYPQLSAKQVKQILMESGTPVTEEVVLGETQEKRPFTEASKSGRMVNAYNALIMAEKMSNNKLPKKQVKG